MLNNIESRSPANPLPLGLLCLAVPVFLFSGYLWGALQGRAVVGYALMAGGLGMLLSAIAAYRRGDTFDATWLGGYGVFWSATAFYLWFFEASSANVHADLGWIAFAWGVFTAYMFVVSQHAKSSTMSLMLALFFLMYACMWIADAFHANAFNRIAAIAGVFTAIVGAVESFWLAWDAAAPTTVLTRRVIPPGTATPQPMG